jgi:hypothetical protein
LYTFSGSLKISISFNPATFNLSQQLIFNGLPAYFLIVQMMSPA